MLKVTNLNEFARSVESWFDAVEEAAADAAKGMARQAFNQLLYTTPQFSGDMAANWKIQINGVSPRFEENAVGGRDMLYDHGGPTDRSEPFKVGAPRAINYAKQMTSGALDGFRLGGTIYLHNSAAHDEPYAWKVEDGVIRFRPENQGAAHVVRRAAAFVGNRYKTIYGSQLAALRRFGV